MLKMLKINLQLFAEEPAAPEVPEAPETPTPDSSSDLSREEFTSIAPFLRKRSQESPKPEEEKTPEPVVPEVKPGEKPELKPDEKPEGTDDPDKDVKDEQKPETVIKLPDNSEATLEEIAEWKKGHMMQKDYTIKTQQLAEERRQLEQQKEALQANGEQADKALNLWKAFERDPIRTINELTDYYAEHGIVEPKDDETLVREDQLRKKEEELSTRERTVKEQEAAKIQAAETEAYNSLIQQFDALSQRDPNLNKEDFAKFMMDEKIYDVEKAYKAFTHDDKVQTLEQRLEQMQKEFDDKLKAVEDEAVNKYIKAKESKSNTPPPVGVSTGGSPPVQINRPKSFQDARKSAMARDWK